MPAEREPAAATEQQERFLRAKRRVATLRGFYFHLTVYCLVNLLLVVIDLLTSPLVLWFYWPLLGWGIGLAMHGLAVSGALPFTSKEWEERKIREIMEREKD